MTRPAGHSIVDSLNLSLGYAERLLKGIEADRFARLSQPGGVIVQSNHPAFVYGHLAIYGPRMLSDLGQEAPAVPEQFQQSCSKDATCVDDPDGTVYPAMEEITEFFFENYRRVAEVLKNTSDDVLQQPNPLGGPMAEKFPTLGSMHNFYVGGHVMLHMGQVSAWRRMEGLGSA
jgi:hypothetical protein